MYDQYKKIIQMNLVAFLLLLLPGVALATHISVASGAWADPMTWSAGTVPQPNDVVEVRHNVHANATLFIGTKGTVTIVAGAKLSVGDDLDNSGRVINHDSLVTGGLENRGEIDNYGCVVQRGTLENRKEGTFRNLGNVFLNGDLENNGLFYATGNVFMKGDLENYGRIETPQDEDSYFEVCGSAKHRNGAVISGTAYLCLICGGSYDKEPGRIGDFIEQCLPFSIRLVDFRATVLSNGEVRLNWHTAGESNSAWFQVERAIVPLEQDCVVGSCGIEAEFKEIGRVPAAGKSATLRAYDFRDRMPGQGTNFYRLRMVDTDGGYSYSPTVQTVVAEIGAQMLAYPNPTNEVLNVRLAGNAGLPGTLSMFSIDGRLVWEREVPMDEARVHLEISACEFASGTYILRFRQGTHKVTRKVVFQR